MGQSHPSFRTKTQVSELQASLPWPDKGEPKRGGDLLVRGQAEPSGVPAGTYTSPVCPRESPSMRAEGQVCPKRHTPAAPLSARWALTLDSSAIAEADLPHGETPGQRLVSFTGGDTEAALRADLHMAVVLYCFLTLCLELSLRKEQRAMEQVCSSLQIVTWRQVGARWPLTATPSVCSGCCHKTPRPGQLAQHRFIGSGGWKPGTRVPKDLVPGERPPPGQQTVTPNCPHWWPESTGPLPRLITTLFSPQGLHPHALN